MKYPVFADDSPPNRRIDDDDSLQLFSFKRRYQVPLSSLQYSCVFVVLNVLNVLNVFNVRRRNSKLGSRPMSVCSREPRYIRRFPRPSYSCNATQTSRHFSYPSPPPLGMLSRFSFFWVMWPVPCLRYATIRLFFFFKYQCVTWIIITMFYFMYPNCLFFFSNKFFSVASRGNWKKKKVITLKVKFVLWIQPSSIETLCFGSWFYYLFLPIEISTYLRVSDYFVEN